MKNERKATAKMRLTIEAKKRLIMAALLLLLVLIGAAFALAFAPGDKEEAQPLTSAEPVETREDGEALIVFR